MPSKQVWNFAQDFIQTVVMLCTSLYTHLDCSMNNKGSPLKKMKHECKMKNLVRTRLSLLLCFINFEKIGYFCREIK